MVDTQIIKDNFDSFHGGSGIHLSTPPQGITVTEKSILVPAQGGLRFVEIKTDQPITVMTPVVASMSDGMGAQGKPVEWLHWQVTAEGINIILDPNTTGKDRESSVQIIPAKAVSKAQTIKVKQSKYSSENFMVKPGLVEVSADATTVDLDVITGKAYTAFCGASWATIAPTYGNQTVVAKLAITKNEAPETRRAQIEFRCGAKKLKVELVQAGAKASKD